MTYSIGHTPNHKGRVTTTQPIKDVATVAKIKEELSDTPRDLALFSLGINSAFRASDILNLRRDELNPLENGCYEIFLREHKTGKLRRVILNPQTSEVLRRHLETSRGTYVFEGQRGRLSVSYLSRLVKKWCKDVDMVGQVATHTLRKTFARIHYERGASLAVLMHALNHDSERTTMRYLGLIEEDTARLYADAI